MASEGQRLNVTKGIAPTTRMLLDQARILEARLPTTVSADYALSAFGRPGGHARVWAHRFRARWGARLGKIRLAEPMSPGEMVEKVPANIFRFLFQRSTCGRAGWARGLDRCASSEALASAPRFIDVFDPVDCVKKATRGKLRG